MASDLQVMQGLAAMASDLQVMQGLAAMSPSLEVLLGKFTVEGACSHAGNAIIIGKAVWRGARILTRRGG